MSETKATNPTGAVSGKNVNSKSTKVGAVLDVTIEKMRAMADSSTIIGEKIVVDDSTVLIPVSKVTYGFASGGSDFGGKAPSSAFFAGGGGGGMTVSPVAFISIHEGKAEVLSITPAPEGSIGVGERALVMAPELIDKIKELFSKKNDSEE